MPELREDPLTGTRVILAPGRAHRPGAHAAPTAPGPPKPCPFCPGNEHETPPEVARTGGGAPETPGWRVRVVPNLYPIVGGDLRGAHEVVVFAPDHGVSFAQLSDERAAEVLTVIRDRCAHHVRRGLVHAQPFVNYGRAAGASLEHPHAQLVALPVVPPAVEAAVQRFAAAELDLVDTELAENASHAIWNDGATAWCSRASLSPYEVLVARPAAGARFDTATDEEIADVAVACRHVLRAIAAVLGDVPYNVVFHTAPATVDHGYHWYVRIAPRISVPAGFEFATGIEVNTVDPKEATTELRAAIAAE